MQKKFDYGDRVKISSLYHWAKNEKGTVTLGPNIVKTKKGLSVFYDVEFDTPQIDADGDGPYSGGAIESEYLELIE